MPTLELMAFSDALLRILRVAGVVVAVAVLAAAVIGVLVTGALRAGRYALRSGNQQQGMSTAALLGLGARHAHGSLDAKDRSPAEQ
jgi:hypothetical protein